jgi:hypothetical protein
MGDHVRGRRLHIGVTANFMPCHLAIEEAKRWAFADVVK